VRLLPLGAIGAGVAFAMLASQQASPAAALSPAMRTHLQSEQFQIVTSIRGLPLGVRERMQEMFGSTTLDIADPGAEFRRKDAPGSAALPLRRLIAAGCAADSHCLVYYERGGSSLSRRVMLFHWAPAETRFEWGAPAPADLTSVDAVRQAIVSGTITGGQATPW